MEVHVMSKKNTRRSLDTSISYAVIGLDLAKADAAVAAVPCSNDEMGLIDRMDYATLFEQAEKLPPTLFAMEPCCGYSHICLRLQSLGHDVKVISGRAVKNWIATHKANQKTDLNDAIALAKLALHDDALTPIRVKSVEQCRMATVQTIRRQLRTQATKSLVCFKSTCQSWGIVIPRGSLSTKKMEAAIAGAEDMLGAEVTSSLKILLDAYKVTVQSINELDKKLDALVQNNEQARLMNSVLGIGTQTAARLATITGDIKRFQTPRSYVAYIGLAPRNIITGHCGTPTPKKNGASRPVSNRGQGKVSRNGDRVARTYVIQGAASIYMQNCKNQLPACQLRRWLEEQIKRGKPYGKIIVSLAAKLLRIVWALLTYKEEFNIHKAGVPRSVLAAIERPQESTVAAEAAA